MRVTLALEQFCRKKTENGERAVAYASRTLNKSERRYYELVSKFNVGLKTLLHQCLSEPEFYGD